MSFMDKTKHQVLIISAMVALAYFLTYYFQTVLQSKQLYTHFFYIPIILSCMWWKRKGLYVTGALLLVLILNQMILVRYQIDTDDFFSCIDAIVCFFDYGFFERGFAPNKRAACGI